MNSPDRGRRMRAMVMAACGYAGAWTAGAEPAIWRCGNSYSNTPCAEGGARIEAPSEPSTQQRREAKAAARRDQAAAERMRKDRLRLEAEAARERGALVIGPPPASTKPGVAKPGSRRKNTSKAGLYKPGADDFIATHKPATPNSAKGK